MKKYFQSLIVLFLISSIQFANAQEKKFEWMIGGGFDSPVGPESFSNEFNTGLTAKVAAGYFIMPRATLGANLSYNRFGFNKGSFTTGTDIDGSDLSIFELTGIGKYYLWPVSRSTDFYVLGGPGMAYSHSSDVTFTNTDGEVITTAGRDETDFMFTLGAGLRFDVTDRWGLFAEGRYSHVFTPNDNTTYLPIRAGIIF